MFNNGFNVNIVSWIYKMPAYFFVIAALWLGNAVRDSWLGALLRRGHTQLVALLAKVKRLDILLGVAHLRIAQDELAAHIAGKAQNLARKRSLTGRERYLIDGQRREAAEAVAPAERYPSLYTDQPADLERPLVIDGRAINGMAPISAFMGKVVSPALVHKAWGRAVAGGVAAFFLALAAGLYGTTQLPATVNQLAHPQMEIPVADEAASRFLSPEQVAARYADVWDTSVVSKLNDIIDKSGKDVISGAGASSTVTKITATLMAVLVGLIASLITAYAVGRLVFISALRGTVAHSARAAVDPLGNAWREAFQRWRWRLADREIQTQAYNDQLHFATQIDKSPIIEIGHSLGQMEFRGHLLAPVDGAPVRMSVVDLMQHVSVTGASGEGKSRNVYIPLVRQLLQLRKQGYPIAIYATDDKGAIGADIQRIAREVGLPEGEVLTIGTRPDDWRVDLMSGLSPMEFADIVKSVAKQAGGESSDDFWPEMASDLLLNVATVLQAAERTDAGQSFMAERGIRMYSILNILRTASDDDQIEAALNIVINALQDIDGQYSKIAELDTMGLQTSIDYLVATWLPMVDSTKDGIRANARKALRSFSFKDEISAGFADGNSERLIRVEELMSNKVKIINVSQIEHGSAGRLVSIMLKTLFFKLARQAEQRNPQSAKDRLKWWFDPQLESLAGKSAEQIDALAINVFLADEYQALVTASRDDGLSDATVWNVMRSAGVAGVLLTQSLSAYKMAVGDKPAENMLSNWRTKIMLRTEDTATIEEAKKLAGKVLRFQSGDFHVQESAVAIRLESGINGRAISAETIESVPAEVKVDTYFGKANLADPAAAHQEGVYEVFNISYTADSEGGEDAKGVRDMEKKYDLLRSAKQRARERNAALFSTLGSEVDAVRDEDLMQMGRGRALVFVQRAGGTRVEIVKLLDA